MKKLYLFAIMTLTLPALLLAKELPDPVRIYFRIGSSEVDPTFRDNARNLAHIINTLSGEIVTDSIDHMTIEAFASPDGSEEFNNRLAGDRARSISDYIISHTSVNPAIVRSSSGGIAWDELRRMVDADRSVPSRAHILDIIDNVEVRIFDSKGRLVDSRKKRLMDLDAGRPYRYLCDNIFPELRNAAVITLYIKGSPDPVILSGPAETPSESVDKAPPSEEPEPLPAPVATAPQLTEETDTVQTEHTPCKPVHRLAIKSNLIYDALLMPNLEIEYRINDRWSVALEGNVAWWHNDSKHKYYQIAMIAPESRYWFMTRNPWHGHYVGLFAGGGKYDLENGGRGYKGEGFISGVTYGFMFPIARNLSFDAEIGLGYVNTRYREYIPRDGHYLFQRRSRTDYFGPVKVKFSLVWRLWDDNCKKKGVNR